MMSLLTTILTKRAIVVGSIAILGLGIVASQGALETESTTATPPPARTASVSTPTTTNQLVQTAPLPGATARANPLWAIPLASLTATKERPIFSPTRRPPPGINSVSTPSLPSAEQPKLALVGAIAGEDEGIAIFRDETTKGTIRMKTGESHFGWTLQAVKAREATLQKDHKTAILALPNPPAQ